MWYGIERPSKNLIKDNDTWINTDEETHVIQKDDYTVFLENTEPLNAILNDIWLGGD